MKKEMEAHETHKSALYSLFHRDGMPNEMAMDGAKAQVEGALRRKFRDVGCHINMGEGGVCELK
jgi:hypothetical protein